MRTERRSRAGRPSTRGRASKWDPETTIGVDIGGTKIALAVVGNDGQIRSSHRHPTDPEAPAEEVVRTITSCVRSCLGPLGRTASAIGVGLAGQIREKDGTMLSAPNLPWRNVPFGAMLREALGVPASITNDVRAATLGEWRYGAGQGVHDLVCVFIGTGVGGGIVADGRLLRGGTGTAGEIGHTTIVYDGRTCHCPNSGCLEAYVGGWAIAERAQEAAGARPADSGRLRELAGGLDKITAETVAQAFRGGDDLAKTILEETVEYLAAGLVGLVNTLNPSLLILGGGVIEGLPNVVPAVDALVRQRALAVPVTGLRIVRSRLGEDAGVLGAAALARGALRGGGRK